MIKLNKKVKVENETTSFTGTVERIIKWENPFSIFKKKGVDYVVRADDDNQLYKCAEEEVSPI
jgi:hypothetical protein